jgi:4-hydroxybenzoyl-CoA reductase subunit beta
MRLPPFDYERPETLERALKIKESFGNSALVMAGGTDLVVNLKHRLLSPSVVLSLNRIPALQEIQIRHDALVIGAAAPLEKVADHEAVRQHFPVLRDAIRSIGALTIQHYRGTLGGNICSLPRCIFYNQSLFWRTSKGLCHRTGGRDCLALPGSSSCQSICSGDTVPVLAALSAQTVLSSYRGSRTVALVDLFSGKGESYLNIAPEEILTEIRLPLPWGKLAASFQKIAFRSAVDFPLVNAAAAAFFEGNNVASIRIALSACGPRPLMVKDVEALAKGAAPREDMLPEIARAASKLAEGVVIENSIASKDYRVKMAGVAAKRAARAALGL